MRRHAKRSLRNAHLGSRRCIHTCTPASGIERYKHTHTHGHTHIEVHTQRDTDTLSHSPEFDARWKIYDSENGDFIYLKDDLVALQLEFCICPEPSYTHTH